MTYTSATPVLKCPVEFIWPGGTITERGWFESRPRKMFPAETTLQSVLPHRVGIIEEIAAQIKRYGSGRFSLHVRTREDGSYHVCLRTPDPGPTCNFRDFHGSGQTFDEALVDVLKQAGDFASRYVLWNTLATIRRFDLAVEAGDERRALSELESFDEQTLAILKQSLKQRTTR